MSGPEYPDAPPPEVPEEFAAAYRDAYRRALEAADGDEAWADAAPGLPEVPAQAPVPVGTHGTEEDAPESGPRAGGWRETRWFLPVAVGASALVLVVAAYAVGSALSGGGDSPATGTASTSASRTRSPEPSTSPEAKPTKADPSRSPGSWDGPVTPVAADAISADCTAPPSQDSAGHKVTYVPGNAIDGRAQTAWRCTGTAVGQKLTLRLAADTDVAEVGLIPGYAKTDPDSGVDRYAENNRITRVRWTIGDGVSVVQRLDPDPASRDVQVLRVPRTTADTITLEILAVERGPRNTTAISEIALAAAS